MRAVWSFWTKPYRAGAGLRWQDERYHLFAWVLSLLLARRHYPETILVTDTPGKTLLVDCLALPFDEVSTALDELDERLAHFWVLGKLYAYRLQDRPFVHLDTDVFLWKPLPADLTSAGFFAQNPEFIDLQTDGYYHPYDLDLLLERTGGWRPAAWTWALQNQASLAVNCGILGGTNLDFIQRYAADAIRMIEHPANQPAWDLAGNLSADNIVLEQYLLGAWLGYTQAFALAGEALTTQFLFGSFGEAFDEGKASSLGYTHLIGESKSDPALLSRLEHRLERDYPRYYERCLRLLSTWKG